MKKELKGKKFVLGMLLSASLLSSATFANETNTFNQNDSEQAYAVPQASELSGPANLASFLLSRITEVEGGAEELRHKLVQEGEIKGFIDVNQNESSSTTMTEEEEINEFLRVGGAIAKGSNGEKILPFSIRLSENDDRDVEVSVLAVSNSKLSALSRISGIKYEYSRINDIGKKEGAKVIDFMSETPLVSSDNTYVGLVVGGNAGSERYELKNGTANDTEIDMGLTASGEAGLSLGSVLGKNRIYAYSGYQWNYDQLDEENSGQFVRLDDNRGMVAEVGIERALSNGKSLSLKYQYDDVQDDIQDSSGNTLNTNMFDESEHTIKVKFTFW